MQRNHTKKTTTKKKSKPKTQTIKPKARKRQSSRLARSETSHCIIHGVGMAEKTQNQETTYHKHRHTRILWVKEATQHYAETRAPPSQEPRDRIEQAVRA